MAIINNRRFTEEWERSRKLATGFATERKGVWLGPDDGFARRDRARKRTAFKHGVMFRAARKVMR